MENIISRLRLLVDVVFADFLFQFNENNDVSGKQLDNEKNEKIIKEKIDEMIRNNETTKDFELSNKEKVTLTTE
ncbi:hypothetical protein [Elizabethkingia anophelis]|uniref:hypothetical protein n=1 Tax=Elizabethkingia anophelis TaxID=1117645 RepID=UPI000C6E7D13|nr:hypothetical protein [Elizabethkingia anophelis]PKR32167.1 hypothetical protein CWH99_15855 [Elizabethkingia anophelis]PKR33253.1 hypothetical protein CWI00_18545 [Elizabethkingia anophelis]PRQ78791.1 hypothetical protein CMT60_15785 [Elizabethkingia anophelis]PRQ86592.1 hypothetical protein CMT87_01275 [Elizabethkingia anophelis]PRQ88095.1 hypothetical protein CMT86_06325 [Elizabethkingia anophelis]